LQVKLGPACFEISQWQVQSPGGDWIWWQRQHATSVFHLSSQYVLFNSEATRYWKRNCCEREIVSFKVHRHRLHPWRCCMALRLIGRDSFVKRQPKLLGPRAKQCERQVQVLKPVTSQSLTLIPYSQLAKIVPETEHAGLQLMPKTGQRIVVCRDQRMKPGFPGAISPAKEAACALWIRSSVLRNEMAKPTNRSRPLIVYRTVHRYANSLVAGAAVPGIQQTSARVVMQADLQTDSFQHSQTPFVNPASRVPARW
jgi:hypothetical protein